MANVEIPQEVMKSIVVEMMFKVLPEDKRDALLKEALANVMNPGGYNSKPPIVLAFQSEMDKQVREMVGKHLEGDSEVREKLRALVVEAFDRALNNKREEVIEGFSKAFLYAISEKTRY